jgi:RimJ/RimL family protein N-acetyltransferase
MNGEKLDANSLAAFWPNTLLSVDRRGKTLGRASIWPALSDAISAPSPALGDAQILLRPWKETDLDGFRRACDDDEITRWAGLPAHVDEADAREYLDARVNGWKTGNRADFAITSAVDGRFLGAINLRGIDRQRGLAEVGFWLFPEARGAGVASRALAWVSEWAFGVLGLGSLVMIVDSRNVSARKLAERAGFRIDCIYRREIDGEVVEDYTYSLSRAAASGSSD